MKNIFIAARGTSLLLALTLCLFAVPRGRAQSLSDEQLLSVTFDQKLNAQIDPGLRFRDENGREVRIGDYLGKKPVVLVLGYYQCPMLCTLTLNGLVQAMEDMKWSVGKDFDIVDVSINPHETPALALAKKHTYLKRYGRSGADVGWHFLTGDESAIRALTGEAGFKYVYDPVSKQYAHASGLVILTPEGKISRYLFGVTYHASDLYASLHDASGQKISSPIQQLVLLCFHYNPIKGKYGAAIMFSVRVLAIATLLGLAWLVISLVRRDKRRQSLPPGSSAPLATAPNIGTRT
jgi:protein SCO1/2